MICTNCGGEYAEGDKFCPHCGAKSEQKTRFCTNCGNPIDPEFEYCRNCGVKIHKQKRSAENIGFVEAYKLYWKNAFNFNGRASVAEFWFAELWNLIISIGAALIFIILTVGSFIVASGTIGMVALWPIIMLVIFMVWGLVNLIPSISLIIRRITRFGQKRFVYSVGAYMGGRLNCYFGFYVLAFRRRRK